MSADDGSKKLKRLTDKFIEQGVKIRLYCGNDSLYLQLDGGDLPLDPVLQNRAFDLAARDISDRVTTEFFKELVELLKSVNEVEVDEHNQTPVVDNSSGADNSPPTLSQVQAHLQQFIAKNLGPFNLKSGELEKIAEQVAKKGAKIQQDFDLTRDEINSLAVISLYDIFFLCDDSGSMKIGNRIPALVRSLQSIAAWATLLEPSGVSVRFLNFTGDMNNEFDNLRNEKMIADKVYNIPHGRLTRLGTVLKEKILQHKTVENLTKPLIVVIITDGEPKGEDKNCLWNNIVECKQELGKGGKEAGMVFIIFRVGNSNDARVFLNDAKDDAKLDGLVYRSDEPIDGVLRNLVPALDHVRSETGEEYKEYKRYVQRLVR
ncbi:von willebrand factor type A domain-containing protein [Hirsutella rhossiliensis]|uniref:von willebrand factor type A domain-containing protein n=1 Tax=Hirsutella rhossiliensis TaxID=111463 RepID=A0A9P8SEL3_9HYPO|nr:von willebrand factor type A domain-containing protein [Hirsutella rhossiliensis]KAH0959119.1 von willebrand factor type A domain-containing protein [Hirsutella rhossiliensis]